MPPAASVANTTRINARVTPRVEKRGDLVILVLD
jgi:hypothetical protein